MKVLILTILASLLVQGCSSNKTYENTVFPEKNAAWEPVNPEHFGKNEAQRIFEGSLIL